MPEPWAQRTLRRRSGLGAPLGARRRHRGRRCALPASCERSVRRSSAPQLDQRRRSSSRREGTQFSLRWIIVHMIEETARHNGHLDLLREAIDGSASASERLAACGVIRRGRAAALALGVAALALRLDASLLQTTRRPGRHPRPLRPERVGQSAGELLERERRGCGPATARPTRRHAPPARDAPTAGRVVAGRVTASPPRRSGPRPWCSRCWRAGPRAPTRAEPPLELVEGDAQARRDAELSFGIGDTHRCPREQRELIGGPQLCAGASPSWRSCAGVSPANSSGSPNTCALEATVRRRPAAVSTMCFTRRS